LLAIARAVVGEEEEATGPEAPVDRFWPQPVGQLFISLIRMELVRKSPAGHLREINIF
jgi:hypothetical protein|tara:strand:- start:850 stop:1023 length:174 start_codon:yes stop_codon:yes gene_type:complete